MAIALSAVNSFENLPRDSESFVKNLSNLSPALSSNLEVAFIIFSNPVDKPPNNSLNLPGSPPVTEFISA